MKQFENIKIIDSTPDDLPGIYQALKITWLDTYPNEEYDITPADIVSRFLPDNTKEGEKRIKQREERYKDPNYHLWVAKNGQEIVGLCTSVRETNHGRIQAIYVLPSYQGRKIGWQLMEAGLSWLGNQDVYINVVSYNQKAINFYEKCGFVKTGKIVQDPATVLPTGKIMPEIEMVKKVNK